MEYKVIHIGDTIELGYSPYSGVKIIYVDGLPFKDNPIGFLIVMVIAFLTSLIAWVLLKKMVC